MKALIQSAFGPAIDVLDVAEIERPTIGAAEVLVRVVAAGVAKGNWLITRGLPWIARPAYGWRRPRARVAGLAFAGRVESVGDRVTAFAPGDAVLGSHAGAMAEFVSVPAGILVRKPDAVDFEQAAAAPVSGIAALRAVRDAGRVEVGQRVLVVGASGGVGAFAVQIAAAFGATVTGVASTRHLELVSSLGACDVIDYTREEITARTVEYDVILDIAGNRPLSLLRRALTPKGTLVIVGGTGSRLTMGFERTIGGMMLSPIVRQRIVGLISLPNQGDLAALAELMAEGKVTPVVARRSGLEQAPEAIEHAGRGGGSGTLVITL